jgi:hypothetical protein
LYKGFCASVYAGVGSTKRKPMKRVLLASALLVMASFAAGARWTHVRKDISRVRISIYHVAPGRQLDFLRYWATQDEVAKEAGVAPVQLYAHIEGDSWDYLLIRPVTTPEQDEKLDDIAEKKGLKTGIPASLEFRQFLASHTDTLAAGPMSPETMVKAAQ